jgi:uncharacterized surface protein with fasciclin (FAS1) repeats
MFRFTLPLDDEPTFTNDKSYKESHEPRRVAYEDDCDANWTPKKFDTSEILLPPTSVVGAYGGGGSKQANLSCDKKLREVEQREPQVEVEDVDCQRYQKSKIIVDTYIPLLNRAYGLSTTNISYESNDVFFDGERFIAMPSDEGLGALSEPQFTGLVDLVKKAGLLDTLKNMKDFTLFAPTNTALSKLKAVPPNLKELLLHHIIPFNLSVKDLKGTYFFDTLANKKVLTSGNPITNRFYVNDSLVVPKELKTSGGTVYEIDNILIPVDIMESMFK